MTEARLRSQRARRHRRRAARVLAHPRCAICDGPMHYRDSWQGGGVNLSAVTCSRRCAYTRDNWFGRVA